MESPSDNTLSDTSEQVMKNSEVNSESSSVTDTDKTIQKGILISSLFYIKISLWFFGYSIISGATTSILWPFQIQNIVGDTTKEYWNGVVPISGMFINLVATPVFGYISDCSKTPFGKRRPFLLIGSLLMIVFLAAAATYGKPGDSIGGFIVILMGFHLGQGIAGGAFSGIIPDIVHPSQSGIASGWLGVAFSLGTLIGSLVGGVLAVKIWYAYGFVIAVFGFLAMMSVILLKEDYYDEWSVNGSFVGFFKSLYLPAKTYYNFYWVLITRFFNTMGVYMVLAYLHYFASDILHLTNIFVASIILAVIIVFSIPSSILGGYLADYYNTKLLVYISSSVQVIAMSLFITLCYYPSYPGLLVLSALFGTGYGAYQCVDWALALQSLPSKTIGKDMGIWHIAFIAPTVVAPAISGSILKTFKYIDDAGNVYGLPKGYAVVFAIATMWFILSTVFIFPMKLSAISFKAQQRQKETQMKELSNSTEGSDNNSPKTTEIKSV